MKPAKLLARLARSQTGVRFADLVRLAEALGFVHHRTAGSHRIYIHARFPDAMLNLQPDRGQAKPYQIKQFLKLVEEYNLHLDEPDG